MDTFTSLRAMLLTDLVAARTPHCNRKVRGFPFMVSAVEQYSRTCPKCGTRYLVTVRPIGQVDGGSAFAHSVTWDEKAA